MSFNLMFTLSLMLFSSCGILSGRKSEQVRIITIHGTIHKPYCGGAKPSPEIAAGYYEPMSGQTFKVFKGAEYSPELRVLTEFTFDQEGNANLQLEPGNYVIMQSDKLLTLDNFMHKYGTAPTDNFVVKDRACFNEWKNSVDLFLHAVNDTLIQYIPKAHCWVGTNPCLEYVGPPAP